MAVTCIAIVVGGESRDVMDLLRRVRESLAQEFPRVDFDKQTAGGDGCIERPLAALEVLVDEVNVASRLTRNTTRHMVDLVSMILCRSHPCTSQEYAEWRRRTMVCCTRLRPRDAQQTVAHTLYTSVARLDGHPVLDAVYVDECDGGVVCVYATLNSDADVTRYGFRDTDTVEWGSPTHVVVGRGRLRWHLCTSPSRPSVAWDRRSSVTDVLAIGAAYVPNVPHLSLDVEACFDPHHWTVQDVYGRDNIK